MVAQNLVKAERSAGLPDPDPVVACFVAWDAKPSEGRISIKCDSTYICKDQTAAKPYLLLSNTSPINLVAVLTQ